MTIDKPHSVAYTDEYMSDTYTKLVTLLRRLFQLDRLVEDLHLHLVADAP